MKLVDRAKAGIDRARQRSNLLDHAVRAVTHYVDTQGNVLAGSATYFGFLSVFPLLVIGFAMVGFVTGGNQLATQQVVNAIEEVFPGMASGRNPTLDVADFRAAAGAASVLGSVALLYTGLNWVGSLRTTLQLEFTLPLAGMPSFLVAKVRDLGVLLLLGVVLLTSVSLSAVVSTVTAQVLDTLGFDALAGVDTVLIRALGVTLGVATSTLLFFVMYRLLPQPDLPRRALLQGALVAAVAFELLKLVATKLIAIAGDSPPAAVIGTVLVVIVWINLFSRIALLGAAWAATSLQARQNLPELREEASEDGADDGAEPVAGVRRPPVRTLQPAGARDPRPVDVLRPLAVAGLAAVLVRWLLRGGQG